MLITSKQSIQLKCNKQSALSKCITIIFQQCNNCTKLSKHMKIKTRNTKCFKYNIILFMFRALMQLLTVTAGLGCVESTWRVWLVMNSENGFHSYRHGVTYQRHECVCIHIVWHDGVHFLSLQSETDRALLFWQLLPFRDSAVEREVQQPLRKYITPKSLTKQIIAKCSKYIN